MNITIKRYRQKTDTIDGHLYIDGQKVCDTAENAHAAVPEGTYSVVISKCLQYSRKMPIIQFTDNSRVIHGNSRSKENPCASCPKLDYVGNNTTLPVFCPQLKPGNGVYNRTDGSIILGTYIVPGCLKRPREAFDSVYDRLRKSADRGHKITLTIINEY